MATLQQLQFKTTAGTGTQHKEGTGSQLAKLVMQGLNLASNVGNAMENQRQTEERDNRTQDETNQKFIQSKMIDYQSKNPNQNAEFYETYANKGLREDPEYLERFEQITNADGSKSVPSPTDVMKTDLYKENMNLWSTRWVKESRLTDEQLQQKQDRANAKADSLLYADLTKQIEQKQIDADYNNLDIDKQIEFNTQLKQDLEKQNFGSSFLTQESRDRYDGVIRNISKNTLNLKYQQDKTNVVDGLNNLVKTVAIDKNTNLEDITNMTDKANDVLSTKDELKVKDVLKVTIGNISNHITANPDKFKGMTSGQILKEFPLISEIKDQSILKNLKSQIKTIDLATKKTNEIIDIVTGKIDSSVAQYSNKSDWAKTLSGAYINAADDTGRQAAIALSVKSNLPIGSIENAAKEFTNGEVLDPATSFTQYSMLKQADNNNYNIRAKGYDEKALRLETIADVKGFDINTEDGYKNTLLARERIDEQLIVQGYTSNNKATIKSLNEAITKKLESTLIGSALMSTQLPQSARTNIVAYSNVILNENPTMDVDDAVEKATDLYKKKFKDTGYVDLRDAGINTAKDYSALKSMLSYQSGLEVDNIEVFGDAVFVNFDGGSTKELDQQNFSMNDISVMVKNAKDNNETNVKKNPDNKYGGSNDGMSAVGAYIADEGIFTNKDMEEKNLEVTAGFVSQLIKDGKPGDRFTINESTINAYFGISSTDHLKKNFQKGKDKGYFEFAKDYLSTAFNMGFGDIDVNSDPQKKAYLLHGLIGKAEAVINDDGSVSINGSPMIYDFTKEDNKSLIGLGGDKDKFKSFNIHFTKSNLGIKEEEENYQLKRTNDLSKELGLSKSSIMNYGLYSIPSEQFIKEFKAILDQVKGGSKDISDDNAIKETFDVLNSKHKNVFNYKNKYYALGDNAIKYIQKKYPDSKNEQIQSALNKVKDKIFANIKSEDGINEYNGLVDDINKDKINQVTKKTGGSISWRNNNPGNLKFAHNQSADKSDRKVNRGHDKALASAKKLYKGVVGLDRYGNAIFKNEKLGRDAKMKFLKTTHKNRTIEQMIPEYAKTDYSGKADPKAYYDSILKYGNKQGVDLSIKKIKDLTQEELDILGDAMQNFEGYKIGKTTK